MMPRILLVVGLLGMLAFGACGERDGVDRSHYQPVFDAAMRAVAAGDLPALDALLTPAGRQRLHDTLRAFQHRLQDPVQAARILALVEEQRGGPVEAAEVDAVRHGTLAEVWTFLLRADPRDPVPDRQTARPAGEDGIVIEYADPRGTLRTVTLRLHEGGWAVEELQL